VGARFSAPVQTGPGAHAASCTMGTGSFLGVKYGRGVTLTPHLLLVPWSLMGRAIPLLPLWAVRPVQKLSACTRVHFTISQCLYKGALYLTSVPVQGCTIPYLSACTRVHYTLPQCLYKGALYLTSVPVQGCTLPYLIACTRVHYTLPQCLYKGALYLTCLNRAGCDFQCSQYGEHYHKYKEVCAFFWLTLYQRFKSWDIEHRAFVKWLPPFRRRFMPPSSGFR